MALRKLITLVSGKIKELSTSDWVKGTFMNQSRSTSNGTTTTSEEVVSSCLIPGGTLAVGDAIEIYAAFQITSTSGSNKIARIKANTAANTSGTTLQSGQTTSTGGTFFLMARMVVLGSSSQVAVSGPIGGNTFGVGNTQSSSLNIANDIYINFTTQKPLTSDAMGTIYWDVRILRATT